MARQTRPITLGLAWRLFLAQAFTVLFAVVALILTWGDKESWNMDMFTAEDVARPCTARARTWCWTSRAGRR